MSSPIIFPLFDKLPEPVRIRIVSGHYLKVVINTPLIIRLILSLIFQKYCRLLVPPLAITNLGENFLDTLVLAVPSKYACVSFFSY